MLHLLIPLYDERVLGTLELLNAAELGEHFDFEQLASAVGLSLSHLIRLFRRDLQTTPRRYWESLRVEHARRRLLQPNKRPWGHKRPNDRRDRRFLERPWGQAFPRG